MIDIIDLKGLGLQEIIDLINEEASSTLEICVPKSTQRYFSESAAIAYDYAYAAYAGQKLFEISTSFNYDKVPIEVHESILFEINTNQYDKLADILLDLSHLYGINEDPEYEDGEMDLQAEDVEEFLYEIELGKIIPCCAFFIKVYNKLIQEDYVEESEDISPDE